MELKEVLEQYPKEQSYLIEILLKYQKSKLTHHLTEDELKDVAEYLDLPESHVFSVVSFYSFFSMKPRGRFIIQYCRDVPCHVHDDFSVKDALEEILDLKTGETSKDRLFTLEYSSCLGACDGAPVIRINEKLYNHITKNKLKAIITEYRSDVDA